jgi:hypothetical protein
VHFAGLVCINYITKNGIKNVKAHFFEVTCNTKYMVNRKDIMKAGLHSDIKSPQGQMWSPEQAVKQHSSYNDLAI